MPELIDRDVVLDPKRNRYSAWKKARDRMIGEVWPELIPTFHIHPGARVFTIGSCFARNIEEHLKRLGFRVPMLDFSVPREEWPARQNGILNKYTPAAIFQEIDWAKNIFLKDGKISESDSAAFLYECSDGLCIDTNLGRFVPVTRERFFQRRTEVYNIFKEAFSADYIVMTLGLIEAWFDLEKKVYIQEAPVGKDFQRNNNRFGFQILTYEQCREFIQNTVDTIRGINKEAKFLITTSPVPLSRTFADQDVIVANTYSKSLLRTVAGDIATSNKHVDYFPSYESVVLTKSWDVWAPDLIHVADAFVGKVIARLTDTYCTGLSQARRNFLQSYIDHQENSLAKAIELARQAVEESPQSSDLRKHYGHLLAQSGDLKEAEAQYVKAMAVTPQDPLLHFRVSEVLARQGRVSGAIAAAHRSTELAPDNNLFHRHLARLWLKDWKLGKAAVQLTLASGHRRLIKTKNRGLKRLLRLLLTRLERTTRVTENRSVAKTREEPNFR
jgi:tetratricopeptide (TPR) repeat protein